MYRGFRRSRIVMGVTLALTVALTVFVWMRNRGRAVYIPVLASVLLLGIGCTAARLLGNITASVACTGMLGILHMDLDPEAFLEQFLPVARRIPGESRDGMVCRFYLSDSYFAAGRYAEAKSVLGELPARFYTDAPVAGVWYADLARAELALGENADEAMEGLRGIIALSGGKAALRKNLQESLSLLEARRDAAAGQPVLTHRARTMPGTNGQWRESRLTRSISKITRSGIRLTRPWAFGSARSLRRRSAGA